MTPSSPSWTGYSNLQKGPARPLASLATIALALLFLLAVYFIGRQILWSGDLFFDGGR